MKKIKKQHWLRYISRDIPLIRLVIIYESYSRFYKKDIGWSYISGISVAKKGFFNIYRSAEGLSKYSENFLKIKNKKQFYKNLLKKLKQKKQKVLQDMHICCNQLEGKPSEADLIKIFKILYQDLKYFWSIQNFPMSVEAALNYTNNNQLIKKYKKYLIEMRKESQFVTVELEDLFDSVLKRIAKKKKIDPQFIKYATPSEVIDNKLNQLKLKKRDKLVVTGYFPPVAVYEGRSAQFIAKHFDQLAEQKKTVLLKGNSAYGGQVKGTVKVILYRQDLTNLKPKQILVTPMTEAYYVPYLKKVSAIVTNEGGVTCHAAIISRELKIPCIVGTKVATQALKDGDRVEVDANKGIIRILKSK